MHYCYIIIVTIFDHVLKQRWYFAAGGHYSSLCPEATRLLKSRRTYSQPEAAIVACGQWPQGFLTTWSNKDGILRPEAAIVPCGKRPQDS